MTKRRIPVLLALLAAACAAPASEPAATPQPKSTAATDPAPTVSPTENPGEPQWWRPEPGASWQIQFTGEAIDTSPEVEVYELDLFETTPELVDELHAAGRKVVCYLDAGSWEDWRPDAGDFPAEMLGNDYEGWPGERWLDIRAEALRPILEARLDLCASKGFDGVEADNVDGFSNATGFAISREDQVGFDLWLAGAAHARGLGIALKNAPDLAPDLAEAFDWTVVESCFAQDWCRELAPFLERGKAVFAIEYVEEGMDTPDFCPQAAELGISPILKQLELDAWAAWCQ